MQTLATTTLDALGVEELGARDTMEITGGYGAGYGFMYWFGYASRVLYDTENALEASGQSLGGGA